MYTLEFLQNITENHLHHRYQFCEELMEEAKKGNILYFKETLDNLSKEDMDNLCLLIHPVQFLKEISVIDILRILLLIGIRNYDEDIIKYIFLENKILLKMKDTSSFYFNEEICLMIELSMFEICEIVIKSISIQFEEFIEFFNKCVNEENLPKIEFIIKVFNVSTFYLFGFLMHSLNLQKRNSALFLKEKIKEIRKKDMNNDSELISKLNMCFDIFIEKKNLQNEDKLKLKSECKNLSDDFLDLLLKIYERV